LTSFLISHYKLNKTESSSKNICYFFFKADNDEQRDPVHALCAILHQIYTVQPVLIKHAKERLEIKSNNTWNLGTLWKNFTATVNDPQSNNTLCFIDALDECDSLPGRELINLISKYFTTRQESELGSSPLYLKLLITSRPENSIKAAFDRPQFASENRNISQDSTLNVEAESRKPDRVEQVSMIRLRREDETDAICRDIELVVKAAIRGIILEGLPAPLLSDLEGELISRADRNFLWTTLMIKLLKERSEAGASRRELDAILQSRSIDAIYAGLLEGRKDPAQARKMLNIIVAATRPLTLEELNIALAIKPDYNTFTDSFAPRRPGRGTFDDLILDLVYPFENYVKSSAAKSTWCTKPRGNFYV
jgi:protein SERAC1